MLSAALSYSAGSVHGRIVFAVHEAVNPIGYTADLGFEIRLSWRMQVRTILWFKWSDVENAAVGVVSNGDFIPAWQKQGYGYLVFATIRKRQNGALGPDV